MNKNDIQKYFSELNSPPKWLADNVICLFKTGSHAYGTPLETSDIDIEGIVVPPKHIVYPHEAGHVPGFGTKREQFKVFNQNDQEHDVKIHSVVHFCQNSMQNHPNFLNLLYIPEDCIIYDTKYAKMIREHADLFLHKGSWHKHKGFAYSQLSKAWKLYAKGDINFAKPAYHAVRLLIYGISILSRKPIPYRDEHLIRLLNDVRSGSYKMEWISNICQQHESIGDNLYDSTDLKYSADEHEIRDKVLKPVLESFWRDHERI